MQRAASAYVIKRIKDELFSPPAEPDGPDESNEAQDSLEDTLDGYVVHDEDGQPVGTAHRIHDVAVYVVSNGYGDPEVRFAQCLSDPDSRLIFHTEDGRVTAVIYVPDKLEPPGQVRGTRADEV